MSSCFLSKRVFTGRLRAEMTCFSSQLSFDLISHANDSSKIQTTASAALASRRVSRSTTSSRIRLEDSGQRTSTGSKLPFRALRTRRIRSSSNAVSDRDKQKIFKIVTPYCGCY